MIEYLIGIVCLRAIISLVLYLLIYFLARNCKKTRDCQNNTITYSMYASSIIFFLALSSVVLLLLLVIDTSFFPTAMNESGLSFSLLLIVAGVIIQFLYYAFFSLLDKVLKSKNYYPIDSSEKDFSWLLLCGLYALTFFIQGHHTYGCTFLVVIVANFFWIGFDKTSFKKKIKDTFSLKLEYIYVVVFLALIGWTLLSYKTNFNKFLGVSGTIIGILGAALLSHHVDGKSLKKTIENEIFPNRQK